MVTVRLTLYVFPGAMLGILRLANKESPVVTLLEEVFMRMFVVHALAVPLP